MKVIIAGGRDFTNFFVVCNSLINFQKQITEIISGDATGADSLGIQWAQLRDIPVKHFPAHWDIYGNNAGYIRNAEMGEYADALIAFWNGKSRGTKHMIQTMKFRKKPYIVFDYSGKVIMEGGFNNGN